MHRTMQTAPEPMTGRGSAYADDATTATRDRGGLPRDNPILATPRMPATGTVAMAAHFNQAGAIPVMVMAVACADMSRADHPPPAVWGHNGRAADDPIGSAPDVPAARPMAMTAEVDQPGAVPVMVMAVTRADVAGADDAARASHPVATIENVSTVRAVAM